MAPDVKQDAGDVLAAIRELHRPVEGFWLGCDGCDSEGFEAETPSWPCRTAQLVYTPDEIELYEQQARNNRAAVKAQREANPEPSLIPVAGEQMLATQLKAALLLDKVILNREHP